MASKLYDGRARKIGLHITIFRPRRSNNWYLRWREPAGNGRTTPTRVVERSTGQSNLALAMKVAQQKEDELERTRLNGPATTAKPRRILLDHARRVHLRDLESVGRGFEHCKKTRQRLNHFAAYLRGRSIRYLDEVTTYAIQEYINDLSGRLKPRTVKNYATTLTGFFNANVAYDWTPENLAGIGRDGKLKLPTVPEADKRSIRQRDGAKRVPTGAEFRSLVEACDPWTADAVQLMASTGIRYGELMFLTVTDRDEDTLQIGYKELPFQMPEMVRRLLKDTSRSLWWPKDATDRVIPLTNMARDVLQRRVDVAGRAGIPWLFANKAGNPRAHNKALDQLKKAAVAASVMMNPDGTSRLGWHTLRRYFVSIASTCMSLPSVLESAGHDSLAMWKLYRETDREAVIADFKRFDEKMSHEDPRKADEEDGDEPETDKPA